MTGELATIAAEAVPLAAVAASTYGKAVLAKAWDDAADASLKAGLKLLQRVFGRSQDDEELPAAVAEVIEHPGDEDYLAQLRLEIRKAMERDAALAGEIAAIVAAARPATSPSRSSPAATRTSSAATATLRVVTSNSSARRERDHKHHTCPGGCREAEPGVC